MPVDLTINLPTVLSGLVVGGGIVWRLSKLSADHDRTAEKTADIQRQLDGHKAEVAARLTGHEHRIRGNEQGHIALVTRIESMVEMLREVRDELREVLRGRP